MARNIWCYKAWHFNDLVFQAIGPWFPAKTTIWNKLPKCKWPPCKRSSFYLLELSPQCLPAPPCKVMHICQSLRLISVSGPAICIVLTSSVVGVDWFFLHDMERNITHTHMLKKTTVNTRYFIQAIDMLIMHHQKLDTQRFSHFLVRCSQKTVTLVAHGKVSPRTYNMGA